MALQRWKPDNDPQQARRIGKTLEELGELTAVLARINIQGLDAVDPASGKTNRQRLIEETADVSAQLRCNADFFRFETAVADHARFSEKVRQMFEWESHFEGERDGF